MKGKLLGCLTHTMRENSSIKDEPREEFYLNIQIIIHHANDKTTLKHGHMEEKNNTLTILVSINMENA